MLAALVALPLPAVGTATAAQPPRAVAPPSAAPATVRRIVDSAASLVAATYVMPDTGRLIAEHLRRRLQGGAYDRPMSMARLADFLTADMKAVNGDLHLYALYTGGAAAPASGAPAAGGPVMVRRPGPPSAGALAAARRWRSWTASTR